MNNDSRERLDQISFSLVAWPDCPQAYMNAVSPSSSTADKRMERMLYVLLMTSYTIKISGEFIMIGVT